VGPEQTCRSSLHRGAGAGSVEGRQPVAEHLGPDGAQARAGDGIGVRVVGDPADAEGDVVVDLNHRQRAGGEARVAPVEARCDRRLAVLAHVRGDGDVLAGAPIAGALHLRAVRAQALHPAGDGRENRRAVGPRNVRRALGVDVLEVALALDLDAVAGSEGVVTRPEADPWDDDARLVVECSAGAQNHDIERAYARQAHRGDDTGEHLLTAPVGRGGCALVDNMHEHPHLAPLPR